MKSSVSLCSIEEKTFSKTMTNPNTEPQSEFPTIKQPFDYPSKIGEHYHMVSQELLKSWVNNFVTRIKPKLYEVIVLPEIQDFEDKEYQTLVKDNSLKSNKPKIISISEAILNLRKSVELMKKEEEEFNEEEYKRLEEISLNDIDD